MGESLVFIMRKLAKSQKEMQKNNENVRFDYLLQGGLYQTYF